MKSALNYALRTGRIAAEHIPWVLVEPFRGVKGRRLRFLTPEEQRKLVMGCRLEFRPIVQGALYTGARYGELAKARVEPLDLEVGALGGRQGPGQPAQVDLPDRGGRSLLPGARGGAGQEGDPVSPSQRGQEVHHHGPRGGRGPFPALFPAGSRGAAPPFGAGGCAGAV